MHGGVLLTMWERTNTARDALVSLRQHFGEALFETVIPKNVRVEEAHSRHLSVFEYDAASAGAQAYGRLVQEVMCRA